MKQEKTRDSNMELLRLTAMLLVMVVHASYRALPKPTPESIASDPISMFLQITVESFSVMGVNVFVMLSGWYGIRLRWSRLLELFFQVAFFTFLCFGILYALTNELPPTPYLSFLMLHEGDYWFIKTYVALYLLSPILNTFIQTATRRQVSITILSFLAFQWIFGWIFEATTWLRAGYSLPSFICLYLLARYLNVYKPSFTKWHPRTDLCIYLTICAMVTLIYFIMKRYFNLGGVLWFYNSPTTIIAAMFLLLFFSKLKLHSRLINWLAISALAVYLTHSHTPLGQYYDFYIREWHDTLPRFSFILHIVPFIAGVFFSSILIDKVRLLLWHPIQLLIEKRRRG